MIKVLVTGATGFLGSRLVEHLVDHTNKYSVIGTGRKFSTDNRYAHPNLRYILGDLCDKKFVQTLFDEKIEMVINCASFSSPWGSKEVFEKANIQTQQHLIDECQKNKIDRFIYISSPSIYFDYTDRLGVTEKTPLPLNLVNNYAITKVKAEGLLKNSGLDYMILRPRALIGRGDTVIMPRLIRSHLEGKLRIMGNGDNLVDLTSVSNMTEAIRLSMHSNHKNEDFNISNGKPVVLWDEINSILKSIGKTTVTKKIPYPIMYGIASLLELKSKFIDRRKEPVLTRYGVGVLSKNFTFDISKAQALLGYQAKQTTEEAMDEFARWFLNSQQ